MILWICEFNSWNIHYANLFFLSQKAYSTTAVKESTVMTDRFYAKKSIIKPFL